jgi:hypothetical protein
MSLRIWAPSNNTQAGAGFHPLRRFVNGGMVIVYPFQLLRSVTL